MVEPDPIAFVGQKGRDRAAGRAATDDDDIAVPFRGSLTNLGIQQ